MGTRFAWNICLKRHQVSRVDRWSCRCCSCFEGSGRSPWRRAKGAKEVPVDVRDILRASDRIGGWVSFFVQTWLVKLESTFQAWAAAKAAETAAQRLAGTLLYGFGASGCAVRPQVAHLSRWPRLIRHLIWEWWAAQLFYWSCIRKLAMVQFSTVWCVKVSDVEMFKMFRLFLIISFWFPTLRAIPALAGLGCLESRSWDWSQRGAQIDGWSLKSWFKEMVTWRNNRVIWCHIVIWCHMYIYGHLCAYIITHIYIYI